MCEHVSSKIVRITQGAGKGFSIGVPSDHMFLCMTMLGKAAFEPETLLTKFTIEGYYASVHADPSDDLYCLKSLHSLTLAFLDHFCFKLGVLRLILCNCILRLRGILTCSWFHHSI